MKGTQSTPTAPSHQKERVVGLVWASDQGASYATPVEGFLGMSNSWETTQSTAQPVTLKYKGASQNTSAFFSSEYEGTSCTV